MTIPPEISKSPPKPGFKADPARGMPPNQPPVPRLTGLAAIVLAAGRSSRFSEGHKLAAELDGRPMVARVLDQVAQSPVADIVVVVGEQADTVQAAAGQGRWTFIHNPNAAEGLSTSIGAGIAALPSTTQAAMIVLADMPGVTTALITALALAAKANPGSIIHPRAPDGTQGHPVVWPAQLFQALSGLSGDKGAKGLLTKHSDRVVAMDWAGSEMTRDIDTREDLAAYLNATRTPPADQN